MALRVPGRVDPVHARHGIDVGTVELAMREHRTAWAKLAHAEDYLMGLDDERGRGGGGGGGDSGEDARSGTMWMTSEERWREFAEEHWGAAAVAEVEGPGIGGDEAGGGTASVCGVCYHVYRLLDRVRSLLADDEAPGGEEGDRTVENAESSWEERKFDAGDEMLQPSELGPDEEAREPRSSGRSRAPPKPAKRGEGPWTEPKAGSLYKLGGCVEMKASPTKSSVRGGRPKRSGWRVTAPGDKSGVAMDACRCENDGPRVGGVAGVNSATRVLVADSDDAARGEVALALKEEGYAVKTAKDGEECVSMLKAHPCDVVLIEKALSSRDAFEVTKWLRDPRRGDDGGGNGDVWVVPQIVVLTEDVGTADLRSYVGAGMDGCLRKPVLMEKLLSTVRDAAEVRRRRMKEKRNAKRSERGPQGAMRAARSKSASPVGGVDEKKKDCAGTMEAKRRKGARRGGAQMSKGGRPPAAVATPKVPVTIPLKEDPNLFEDVLEYDEDTSFPCMIMDSSLRGRKGGTLEAPSNGRRDKATGGSGTFFNLIVCHDVFDTQERLRILLSPLVARYPGMQVLLWNYPGQAYTTFPDGQVLNNEFHADCLDRLLRHVSPDGEGDCGGRFDQNRPFYIMGHGSGGAVAAYYAATRRPPRLRGLLLLNAVSFVDPHYASVLHDCRNVFKCSPASRPDLPVYFYSRFIFSPHYLSSTSAPMALNVYTAVHNPITLRGRIQLCLGALNHVDVRPLLGDLSAPIISLHGQEASLVRPLHAKSYVDGRRACKSIHQALKGGSRTVVVMMKGGHELLQEQKKNVLTLVEQLLTGYHELNEGQTPWKSGATAEEDVPPSEGCDMRDVKKGTAKRTFEDKFMDAILGSGMAASAATGKEFNNLKKISAVAKGPGPHGSTCWNEYRKEVEKTVEQGALGQDAEAERNKAMKSKGKSKGKKGKLVKESFAMLIDPKNPAFEREDNNIYKAGQNSLIYPDPEEYPEVSEYMSWRLKRNRKRLARLEYSARIIQTALRVFMAKTMVARLRQQAAALTIERVSRGRKGRKIFMQKKKELWAACFTQRATRGHLGRAKAERQRRRIQSQIKMAQRWRGVQARKIVQALIARRNLAATMFQCLWRMCKAKMVAMIKRRRRAASIQIQRMYRGHRGRRKAEHERDKYLFSRSQSSGIELGRQMLAEHKLHATRLQSEISILNKQRKATESRVDELLDEVSQFEEGVRTLEKEMHQLSKAERENAATLKGKLKHELREQKIRLDQEFSSMLAKISDRKDQLKVLEKKLGQLGRTRQQKNEELKVLERKLVVLLEAQETQLAEIRRKQEKQRGDLLAKNRLKGDSSDAVSSGTGGYRGPSELEKQQAAQLMESTETMMKFGFMSMSMTYFSSLNMVNAMKKVAAQDTVMAAVAHAGNKKHQKEELAETPSPVALKSAKPSLQVKNWSVDDVVRWLATISLSQYSDAFREGAVDGAFLCELTDDDLRNTLSVEHKLHRKKILFNIGQLLAARVEEHAAVLPENSLETFYANKENAETRQGQTTSNPAPAAISVSQETAELLKPRARVTFEPQTPQKPPSRPAIQRVAERKATTMETLEPKQKLIAPPPSLEELSTWIRNQKVDNLKEALESVPNKRFDKSCIRVQCVEDIGTAYIEPYEREWFNLNKADEHGNTLMHIAAQNGNLRIAKLLVLKGGNPDHQNKQGQTPGHFAMAYNFHDFASWLFDADGGDANDMLLNMYGLGPYDGLNAEEE